MREVPELPPCQALLVDVRDVAKAHAAALVSTKLRFERYSLV